LPRWKLDILFNEASRQRALDVIQMSAIFNIKESGIESILKVHGNYTEGFYENELNNLMGAMKK